jgi:hypothetical protein
MKKKFNKNTGYTTMLASEYVDVENEFVVVSDVAEIEKYDSASNSYTGEYSHSTVYLAQEGAPQPIKVKVINDKLKLDFLQKVKLNNLEACEVNKMIYFRADKIEVI